MEDRSNRIVLIALAAVATAAYVLMRLRGLTDQCLWFDEIFSIHAAAQPWGNLLHFIALDIVHPPLSYILLKLWNLNEGYAFDIRWVRAFPVLFSVLAMLPVYWTVRDMKLSPVSAAAVYSFLVFNGTLIKYAQEVRMYSLMFCLGAFSVWAFFKFFRMGKAYVLLVVINILLVYTHYYGWLLVLSEVAAILIWQRIKTRRALLMLGINAAAFAPWVLYVWKISAETTGLAQNVGWITRPGISELAAFLVDLVEPVYHQVSSAEPTSIFVISLPTLLVAATVIALGVVLRDSEAGDDGDRMLMLASLFLLPIVTAFVLSIALPFSFWGSRHLVLILFPFALLLGASIENFKSRWLQAVPLGLILALSGGAVALDSQRPPRELPWCGFNLAGASADKWNGRAKYYLFEDLAAYHFWSEARRLLTDRGRGAIFLVEDAEGVPEDKAFFLPRGFDDIARVREEEIVDSEIYLVFSADYFDDTEPPLAKLRARGYRFDVVSVEAYGSVKVFKVRAKREP